MVKCNLKILKLILIISIKYHKWEPALIQGSETCTKVGLLRRHCVYEEALFVG